MPLSKAVRGPAEIGSFETLEVWTDQPVAVPLATLTQLAGRATATTTQAHGFADGDYVRILGATPAGYNGETAITLLDAQTFTFLVEPSTASPATGTITATFMSDAQGGQVTGWRLYVTLKGAVTPLTGTEALQAEAIQALTRYLVETWYRVDLSPKMRLRWRPYQTPPPGLLLEVHSVHPQVDVPRRRLVLECGVVAA